MSEGGFFALRVEPGEPGIVNVPDDLTLTISHVAAAPDAGTTRLSLVTTDYTGATAAAHLLTLQPKKQDHALVDLSFPPGEAVTFAAEGGAVQGRKRVIQRRFNVGVLEAISKRKASTL